LPVSGAFNFLPERPLLSVPALRFFIARLTFLAAPFEYFLFLAFLARSHYKLGRIEHLLELPMDQFAADHLKDEPEGQALPRWKGVIHLTPEASAAYQAAAQQVAKRKSIHRVHLDVFYWRAMKKTI
jgi:hypothetical protein